MPKGVPKVKAETDVQFNAICPETQAELKGTKQAEGKTILIIEVSVDSNLVSAWKMFQALGKVPPIEKVVAGFLRQGFETFVNWVLKVPASPFEKMAEEVEPKAGKKELHSVETKPNSVAA